MHGYSYLLTKTLANLLTTKLRPEESVIFICGKATHKSKNKDKMQNAIIGAVESNSSLKFDTNPNSNTVTITRK